MSEPAEVAADDLIEPMNEPLAEYHDAWLEVRSGLTFAQWEELCASLIAMERNHLFWIGDALNFGERNFGEDWAQAVDRYAAETQRGAKWVCENIPPARRRPKLSYTHHKLVASLVPTVQDELLANAERDGTPTRELAETVRGMRPRPQPATPPPPPEAPETQETLPGSAAGDEPEGLAAAESNWPLNTTGSTPERDTRISEPLAPGAAALETNRFDGFSAGEISNLAGRSLSVPGPDVDGEHGKLAAARAVTEEIAKWLEQGSPDVDIAAILREREIMWRVAEAAQDVLLGLIPGRVSLRSALIELIEVATGEAAIQKSA